jgi:cytochrome c-type biogenesis protein
MPSLSILAAVSAGALSFLSPCVFPIVPGYLSYLTGTAAREEREGRRTVLTAAAFSLGFGLVFVLLGATASAFGRAVNEHRRWLELGGGILILTFGLHLLGVIRLRFLMREMRYHGLPTPKGPLGAVLVGAAFGFGWSPCIGPLLGGILTLAATEETLASGVGLLAAYALGLAVPFMLAALALNQFLRVSRRIRPYLSWVERTGGLMLATFGGLLLTGNVGWIARWVPGFESLSL